MFTALLNALGMAFAMGWEILWPLVLGFALCDRLEASLEYGDDTRRRLLNAILARALVPHEMQEQGCT